MFKKLIIAVVATCSVAYLNAQADGCSSAGYIAVTADCTSPTNGTTTGATQTIAGCNGVADDDVWYKFTATSTSHQIQVDPIAGMDAVVQLFSGGCGTLVSLVCKNDYGAGVVETVNYNSLTIGNDYTVRIYHAGTGSGTGDFSICVTTPPPAPINDECSSATTLNVNATCSFTSGTTNGATGNSLAGCSGTADDDVWYSFVATNSVQNITVNPLDNIDLVIQVYSGNCAGLLTNQCMDNTFTGQSETVNLVGLTAGQTYFVRVYDYYIGTTGDFEICVEGTPTAVPTNDEPCDAVQLPTVTSNCSYSQWTTVGASASVGAPTPSSCVGGSGAAQGGFSASSKDIWFSVTVPSSGNLHITAEPNGSGITDGVMALYSGTCSALTQIACSDDNAAYPGGGNDLLPMISESGLTPGSTVFIRYFGFGSSQGTFGICVTTAENDDCANALYICDINGYSASTSAAYTADRPCNMRGNNEDAAGNNMPDGTNTGGIFGQGGPWGTGAPAFDVILNNNSWIRFTASGVTATLNVSIYDCWVGNYPSGGIQMQVFEGDNCCNFVPVSNFEESSTGFVLTANNLTIGNDYYLVIDGYAGDICNYTITAESGVQFPDIADVPDICDGDQVTLTAPAGATSYEWQHDGSTTQSVTVTPSTTQDYFCEVTGLCDYKQMLDVTVTVKPNPVVTIAEGPSTSICNGSSTNLTGGGADSYVWSTTQTTQAISVSPTTQTIYTVTGTTNGCTDDEQITVNINALPTLSANPTATDSDCGGSTGSLIGAIGSGANPISYSWSNGSSVVGTTADISGIPAGVYTLTLTDGNLCSETFGPYDVINPGAPAAPTITFDDDTPCAEGSAEFTASSTDPSATFDWTGPNSFSVSTSVINFTNVSTNDNGNYCVTATVAGCTGPSACQPLSIDDLPVINLSALNDDTTICLGGVADLTASGATTYSWTGPQGFSTTGNSASINIDQSSVEGYYNVTGTDGNGCISEDSIYLVALDNPTVNADASENGGVFCNGTVVGISATGADSYSWTGPDNYSSTDVSNSIFDATADNEGYYYVTGTDTEGCSDMDSVFVTVVTDVPADASANDTVLCPGETLILTGSGGVSYTWSGPNNYSSNDEVAILPSIGIAQSGQYVLTIVDQNGCLGYDTANVQVEGITDCIFIPNLVTPNFDNQNDDWDVTGLDKYENVAVSIFNRWGNLVYQSSPYDVPWNGEVNAGTTIDGQNGLVPVGTYFYIIELNENGEDLPPYKGYLEVQY